MSFVLDAPLPPEIAGRSHGWFTRYRRYPVFSAPWVRGRLRLVGTALGLFFLLLTPLMLADDPMDRPWTAVSALVVSLLGPALAGPALGLWVRRQGWTPQREQRGLVAAIAAVVLAVGAFHLWGEEPLKNAVARAAGTMGPDGRRGGVALTIGISVAPAVRPDVAGGSAPVPPSPLPTRRSDEPGLAAINLGVRAVLAFFLAGGLALRGWRIERDALAALERERALAAAEAARREAELRLSVLAAQVEPHFLFNTLAGVRSAIATDPARAATMIDRLVEYLRAAIPRLRSDGRARQAQVGAQFEVVQAYLGLMAARMPRLAFSVGAAEPALLGARCPPLMLISLAENAVKHGIEPKIGPARIDVTASRAADGRLALTVADDGVGFGAGGNAGSGLGLANIRERLAQLYDGQAALELKARPDGGVAATILLPLEFDDTLPTGPTPEPRR